MTLQEAIDEVKRVHGWVDFKKEDIADNPDSTLKAIATILNAVVKGELVNDR